MAAGAKLSAVSSTSILGTETARRLPHQSLQYGNELYLDYGRANENVSTIEKGEAHRMGDPANTKYNWR